MAGALRLNCDDYLVIWICAHFANEDFKLVHCLESCQATAEITANVINDYGQNLMMGNARDNNSRHWQKSLTLKLAFHVCGALVISRSLSFCLEKASARLIWAGASSEPLEFGIKKGPIATFPFMWTQIQQGKLYLKTARGRNSGIPTSHGVLFGYIAFHEIE